MNTGYALQSYPVQNYANQQQAAAGQSLNEGKAIPIIEAHVNRISGGAQDLEALVPEAGYTADRWCLPCIALSALVPNQIRALPQTPTQSEKK